MSDHRGSDGRRTSLSSGLAVTALVVVVGVAAAIADRGPAGSTNVATRAEGSITPAVATATIDGFHVPDALRTNEAEVPPHAESF